MSLYRKRRANTSPSLLSLKLHVECSKTCRRACESPACMCVLVHEHSEGTARRVIISARITFKAGDRCHSRCSLSPRRARRVDLPKRLGLYDFLSEHKYLQVQAAAGAPVIPDDVVTCPSRFRSRSREERPRISGRTCIPRFNVTFCRKRGT